jgi:hypothetical protein
MSADYLSQNVKNKKVIWLLPQAQATVISV